jgi:UDP-N-acetylglucosamine 2-epimerase (non-hydrolysing)
MSQPQHVMVIFGTRPEAIKLAPVIHALQADARFTLSVVNTGQHREMLTPILQWFNLQPTHTLDVMTPGQPLASLTGKLLNGLAHVVEETSPDIVLVQGDTTTAMVGALASFYAYDYAVRHNHPESRRRVRVGHVEAGLRTNNIYAPFPEEVNRRLISQLAHWHFAPTATAAAALAREGLTERVHTTGNTVIDALQLAVARLHATPRALPAGPQGPINPTQPIILITGHRRENYGEGFQHICQALKTLAERYPTHQFVYPVHLNQHVQGPVHSLLGHIPNIHLLPPQDYPDFVNLLQHAHIVLTDSGGVQEEAPALGKPVLVMRDTTERPEGVQAGTARLVGTVTASIVQNVVELLENPAAHRAMANAVNPYGDGHASQRIVNLLAE